MKNLMIILFAVLSLHTQAQTINWNTLTDSKNQIATASIGYEYGSITKLAYGYQLGLTKPLLLTGELSKNSGGQFFDDINLSVGAQMPFLQKGNWMIAGRMSFLYRSHQERLVKLKSLGTEIGAVTGWYKPKGHIGLELLYNKAIANHLNHSQEMKDNYAIQDGWYEAPGGNLMIGLQGSKSVFYGFEIMGRIGIISSGPKAQAPLIPFYFNIGLGKTF